MEEVLDLTGKVEYQVNYVRKGVWRCLGGTHKPMRFPNKLSAEHSVQAIREMDDIGHIMVIRITTVYYSDLETRAVIKDTQYVGER